MTLERVAFIGLGVMGRPMATNVREAGFPLTVVDINPNAVSDLVVLGARGESTPREAAAEAEVVISMVRDGRQTMDVMLGENGALAGLKAGGILLLMSTIETAIIRDIVAAGTERGIVVLDAPVSGGEVRAKSGTLTIMVGGDQAAYEGCRPLLAAMGTELFYLGPSGAGIAGKLVNNMLACLHLVAAAEAVRLGARAGVEPGLLVDMLKTATGMSNMVRAWKKIDRALDVGEYYRPDGVWQLLQKDLHLALGLAQEHDVSVPLASLAAEVYDALSFSPGSNPFSP